MSTVMAYPLPSPVSNGMTLELNPPQSVNRSPRESRKLWLPSAS